MLKGFSLIGECWVFRFHEVDEDFKEDGLLALSWTCHMELVPLGQRERFKKVGVMYWISDVGDLSRLAFSPFLSCSKLQSLTLGSFVLWLLVGFGWVISPRPIGGSRVRSGYYHSGSLYILRLDVPWAKGHNSVDCSSPPHSLSPQVPWWLPYLAPSGLEVLMVILCHLPWGSTVSHVAFLYAVHNSGKNPVIKFTIFPIWYVTVSCWDPDWYRCVIMNWWIEGCIFNSPIRH